MQNKPLLSISILVSNRMDTIRKCMESIKPLLDGFPCELIAIDTVGEKTDGSIDVVREYTDKVYYFEWCNDFAKARNFGLEKCSGEWFMFMDDDEWFEDATELVEFFTSGEYKNYNCANYKIRSYDNYEGNYSVASLFRMVKREVYTRFEGRIHEHLTPLREPAKEFSAYVHHYGYVFDTEEEKQAHSRRNISLLEPDFEKDPWNMHVRVQLLQEYIFMPELNEAAERLCKDTLKGDKKLYPTNDFQWCLFAYVKLANKRNAYPEVLERAKYVRKNYPLNCMADIAISMLEIDAHYALENYEKAIGRLEHVMEERKRLQSNPEMKQRVLYMDFVSFLEDGMYSASLKQGICCCHRIGEKKKAEKFTKERFRHMSIPVLTVSVLVSNKKETIRKCLDSIKPLLDAIPSELIVVDTVGKAESDGSLAIAKEYTNHIVPFPWCDDFAAARNAGLQEAKGEWFLYLDDDEWFENVEEIIDFFSSGEYLEYNSATYKVRNYKDLQGSAYTEVAVGRMIHRSKNSAFVGCVNEVFQILYTPHKALSAYVHHYGFVYATPEAKKERMQYTLQLLHKDLEAYPGNLRNRLQLAIVLSVQDPVKAVTLCEETLELCRDKKDSDAYVKVEQLLNTLYAKRAQTKAVTTEEEVKKEVVLSISMLVSNRIDTVKKCMESLRPLLEELSCELIVVDTVGAENSDGSLEIAKKYATKVVHFDWCNDFAAARNAGLSLARGEWFMFLDDDEWFDDVTEIIAFFRSGEYKQYNSATYRIRDYVNKEGSYSMGVVQRMVRLERDTKFVEPVHEYISPIKLPCKALQSFVHHSGYVFETIEKHREHSRRNLSLLRPAFEKNPTDLRLRAQMIQECMFLPELEEEALALCEEVLRMSESLSNNANFQWILVAYVKLAVRLNQWQQAVERVATIRDKFPLAAFANLGISIMELEARERLGQYEEAENLLKQIKASRDFLLKQEEQRVLQEVFDISVFLESDILANAMAKGIISLHKSGKKEAAVLWTKERQQILGKPSLSISLLVSNSIATVERCMKSLQPLLGAIPSELIVVDTVGEENSDGSLAIAKKYATKVVHFDWCDDFAAARNAGLFPAQGEWFMFLDDDEWFEDITEITEFFQSGEYLLFSSATYQIRNYTKKDGSDYSEATLGRMTKRGKNTRFVGTVHETFSELYLPCKAFSCYVHHFGYAYENEQEKRAHLKRNITLLKKELEKNPLELRYRAQMAMELANYDNKNAMEFCEETFRLCADKKQENDFQWQLSLVFRLHEALGSTWKVTEESYRELKKQFGFNETTETGVCSQMIRISILQDEPEQGHPYAKKYFAALSYLQQNPKVQQLQMTADFSRYQTTRTYLEMLHFGAYCAFKAKEYADAWNWYEAMPWEQPGYSNEEGFSFAMQLYRENANQNAMLGIVKRLLKNQQEVQKEGVKRKLSEALAMIKRTTTDHTSGPDWIKSDIKLTIGILVSNNRKTIRNCMESLKPILEAVPSELIVVDTVGEENSDGSLAIAKEYATKVVRFEWCNDFAAARNVCFDHARGEWFLYVDDDEWFDDVQEIIEFFNSGECDKYGQALYYIQNYVTEGETSRAVVSRFVRRTKTTRFIGRVHEVINEVYPPYKMFSLFAHHMGYAFQNAEEQKKHQERNMVLLEQEIKEKGYTPQLCSQMVQELMSVPETREQGYQFCLKCIPILVDQKGMIKNSHTQWILAACVRQYGMIEDYEGALKEATRLRENYALSEMTKLLIAIVVAGQAFRVDEYEVALDNVDAYLEAKQWLDEHPDSALQQSQLDFSTFYTEAFYVKLLHIGASSANELCDFERANRYWKLFPWDAEGLEKVKYWADMQRTLTGLKQLQEVQKMKEKLAEFLTLTKALEDAGTCARELADTENRAVFTELLTGMQETAIAIGTGLDELLGEGTEEVTLLEGYCEELWHCSNAESKEERMQWLDRLMQTAQTVEIKLKNR